MKTHQGEELGGDDICLVLKIAEMGAMVRLDASNMARRETAHSEGMDCSIRPHCVTTGKYINLTKLPFPQ